MLAVLMTLYSHSKMARKGMPSAMATMLSGLLNQRKLVWRLLFQALSTPQLHMVDLANGWEPKSVPPYPVSTRPYSSRIMAIMA